ncbi:hypothetical protein JMN32_15110, partial [Fulvivirga sp. 29W222]
NATDDMLREVLHEFLSSFSSRECSMPLSSLGKFEMLVERLHVILRENKDRPSTFISELITDVLLTEGFNSTQFVYYLIRQNKSVIQFLNFPQRKEYLKGRIKKYKKLLSSGPNIYNPYHVAVSEAMISWCKKQISICRPNEKTSSTSKFSYAGTVAELATLFRGLHEAGLIPDINGSDLSRTVTNLFNTTRAEQISSQSFYNKFLTVDYKAASRIQQQFQMAIDRLDDLKG